MSKFMPPYSYIVGVSSSPSVWSTSICKDQATRLTATFDEVFAAEGWLKRKNDLKVIRRYPNDWDGMGASAPSPRLVDVAIQFLNKMQELGGQTMPPSAVSGTPMGRIMLEWRFGNDYLEAELIDPHHVEWMKEFDGNFDEWTERIEECGNWTASQRMSSTYLESESRDQKWASSSSSMSAPDMEFSPHR